MRTALHRLILVVTSNSAMVCGTRTNFCKCIRVPQTQAKHHFFSSIFFCVFYGRCGFLKNDFSIKRWIKTVPLLLYNFRNTFDNSLIKKSGCT